MQFEPTDPWGTSWQPEKGNLAQSQLMRFTPGVGHPDDRGFLQTVWTAFAREGKIQRLMPFPSMYESKIGRVSADCPNKDLTMKCFGFSSCDLSGFQALQSFNWRLAACLVTHTGRLKLLFSLCPLCSWPAGTDMVRIRSTEKTWTSTTTQST